MIATLETKACQPCAKAKRRCGKEIPECTRCRRRGIECTYLPTKASCFVLLEEDDFEPLACAASFRFRPTRDIITSHGLAFQPYPEALVANYLSSMWFNHPSTWQITPWPQVAPQSFCQSNIKRLIAQIQQWFAQWISTGSNPFIHAQLYLHHLPQCVQATYTALSAYLHRRPENEHLVFQIFEARVTQLLADHGVSLSDAGDTSSHKTTRSDLSTLHTLDHLARVQSLTTYLLVMLFNGDIRLRHIAEQQIPVLETWIQQMVEGGRTALSPRSSIDPFESDALWHAWVLAESLRRTFLVGCTVIALYEMLKAGKPVSTACKGGMVITTRKGAWEAKSAAEWAVMAAEVNMGLMQVGNARKFVQLEGMNRDDVDSFARTFLEETCGDGLS